MADMIQTNSTEYYWKPSSEETKTIQTIVPVKRENKMSHCPPKPSTFDPCSNSMKSLTDNCDLDFSKLPFTWKLYEMLEDVEENGRSHIVSWVNNGTGFQVHKLDDFVNVIIPIYFQQSKYKSFQRQLYFYNFKRTSNGAGFGTYCHPMFIRGRKTLCLSMSPKKNKRLHKNPPATNQVKLPMKADVDVSQNFLSKTRSQKQELPVSINDPFRTVSVDRASEKDHHLPHRIECHRNEQPVYSQAKIQKGGLKNVFLDQWSNREAIREPTGPCQQDEHLEPSDGDACKVFGGKTFHFVDEANIIKRFL